MDKMDIKDNKTGIPLAHYLGLVAAADPNELAARTGTQYDAAAGVFRLRFLGRDVTITHPGFDARYAESDERLRDVEKILLARFLLEARFVESGGKFLAYAEMPWGEVYSKNFNGRCILRLAYGFGGKLDVFKKACLAVGGRAIEGGDAAFELDFLGNLALRLIIWGPDDEFPPSSQILFSDNFQYAFNAEDMAVVGDVLIDRLKQAADNR